MKTHSIASLHPRIIVPSHVSVPSLVLMAFCLFAPRAGAQQVLYNQDFNNLAGSGTQSVLAQKVPGWNAYVSSKAFDMGLANRTQYDYNNDATPPASGAEQAYSYSFSTTPNPGYLGGYMVHATGNAAAAAGSPIMASTYTGLNISLNDYSSIEFSWTANASSVGPSSRLLLQIGGAWFISKTSFALSPGAATALDGSIHNLAFTATASEWQSFTLIPGTSTTNSQPGNGTMSIGATASMDLSGAITGIGLFTAFATDGSQTTVRMDQLNILGVAVPEPSSLILFGLGGLVIVVFRRARARR